MWTLTIAGGGAGVGGATISAAIICLGNASGCKSGQMISAINIPLLRNRARIDQYLLFALILWSDSIKESSNIDLLRSNQLIYILRHRSRYVDPGWILPGAGVISSQNETEGFHVRYRRQRRSICASESMGAGGRYLRCSFEDLQ